MLGRHIRAKRHPAAQAASGLCLTPSLTGDSENSAEARHGTEATSTTKATAAAADAITLSSTIRQAVEELMARKGKRRRRGIRGVTERVGRFYGRIRKVGTVRARVLHEA